MLQHLFKSITRFSQALLQKEHSVATEDADKEERGGSDALTLQAALEAKA